jgi:hypothetical protein
MTLKIGTFQGKEESTLRTPVQSLFHFEKHHAVACLAGTSLRHHKLVENHMSVA